LTTLRNNLAERWEFTHRPALRRVALVPVCACKREQRSLRTDPPVAAALNEVRVMPIGIDGVPHDVAEMAPLVRTGWQRRRWRALSRSDFAKLAGGGPDNGGHHHH
jgi:hypothetical protein